jgi:Flp pilus assembly protein TadG
MGREHIEMTFGERVRGPRFDPAGQWGQSITEFALLAPLVFFMLALIFTGSQYLNAVVGLNGAARAGAIVASNARNGNSGLSQSAVTDAATLAVNREQGCSSCFVAATNQAACAAGANCVWTEQLQTPSAHPIEVVHVMQTVSSYLGIISNFVVTGTAGAES